jgi:hypothetical protein
MTRKVTLPKIDPRKTEHLLRQLRRMAPHYTREWPAKDDDDPGVALLKVFSFIAEGVINRLNRAPDRNFLAFLDMLGIRLPPATPARAPVTFLMAQGTEEAVVIPKGTQVSAQARTEPPSELPYETLETFLAIPAKLAALIAVDPQSDRIYKPPTKFLEIETVEPDLPTLQVTALSGQGSKVLQLEPPNVVQKGEFLRIDRAAADAVSGRRCPPPESEAAEIDASVADHFVVAESQGSIVTVTDPLPRDYVEGTLVRRITDFELFEGRNWQEHILFLGHAKYFAIKSEAQLELVVEQIESVSNLESMNVVWEFFGDTEADKEEGWHRFKLDSDGTLGFSQSGTILLKKPAGEIKEKEIDGRNSRWIRARLDGPLPATPPRPLPVIESITFKVFSSGADLTLDQAFHNDTPLTLEPQFFPFGTEPRIFDRFSMASEEVFSKPGALVTLDFTLDATDLLAAPTGVVTGDKMRVFAHAAAGKLVEFRLEPGATNAVEIKKHGTPPDTRIESGSIPSAVKNNAGTSVGVFARASDKTIYMCVMQEGSASRWIPLGAPAGELKFNPSAVFRADKWEVFVVVGEQLFSKIVDPANPDEAASTSAVWLAHKLEPPVDSTPFAVAVDGRSVVFVTDTGGKTWQYDATSTTWTDRTPKVGAGTDPDPDFLAGENARPYVIQNSTPAEQFRIYLRNRDGELVRIDTSGVAGTNHNHESPSPTVRVASNPFALDQFGDRRIYVRTADNRLWSIEDLNAALWTPHLNPAGFNLSSDPVGLSATINSDDFVSLFSTSDKNSMLEFRLRGDDILHGPAPLQAGPLEIVALEHTLPSTGRFYLHITGGPGQASDNDAVRKLDSGTTHRDFAVLLAPLAESADINTQYELFRERGDGSVKSLQAVTSTTSIQLAAGHAADIDVEAGDFVFVDDGTEFRLSEISSVDDDDDTVQLLTPLPDEVDAGAQYFILRHVLNRETETAQRRSAQLAMLDPAASSNSTEYIDKFLEITSGAGQSQIGRKIVDYETDSKTVTIQNDLPGPPAKDSVFRILKNDVLQGWFPHRDADQEELRPELSWEYFNGRGWVGLRIISDTTEKFLTRGVVTFTIPDDIQKTEVAGQENFWIRARIVGGDYGRELFSVDKDNRIRIEKDPIRPPRITELKITYTLTEVQPPDICLTFNNLNYLDQTAANVTEDKHFKPYLPLEDENKAVYFGFDRSFEGGDVRLYFAAKELEVDESVKPSLVWEFRSDNTWKTISAKDRTAAFTKPESVSLTVPPRFQNNQQFGNAQFWVRATLDTGDWTTSPLFKGVFLNTVDTLQARTVRNEILGSSTAIKNQKFRFQLVPVLEGEEVRVLEFLTDTEREELLKRAGKDAVLTITDQRGEVLQTWIRWTEVVEFFDARPDSRNYRLDRHTGEIEFGDGLHGRIPPAGGDNIQVFSYQTGGTAAGNVGAGEIKGIVTAIAGVDSVRNPVPAGGGSEAATNEEILEIGPAQISHRDRAVTPQDFERLAREASREVRKVLCLPNRNARGRNESGWTSVHIVPASKDATPLPSLELRRSVQRFLSERADLTLVDQDHIFVGPPTYLPVNVEVKVAAKSFDTVATAERSVRQKLEEFLHPLTGGPDKEGWDFGRDLAASDLYALLEDIDEVDHIETLRLVFGDSSSEERAEVDADALIASGTHEIEMTVAVENR